MSEAKKLAKLVIKFFNGRKGFDDWWESLDPDIRKEIESDLEAELGNTIPE